MPPLPVYPYQPTGSPDINWGAMAGTPYGSPVYAGGYRTNGSGGYGQSPDYVTPEEWSSYIQTLKEAYQASSGFEREQLAARIRDADEGRKNALQIAQVQADNSRYGVDVGRQTAIDQLKQRDKEFAAQHQLDTRKADIDEAQLISSQRSEPNRLFQTMDLEQALGSIRAGNRASTMPMSTGVAAIDGLSTDYRDNPYLANPGRVPSTGSGGNPYLVNNGAGGSASGVYDQSNPSNAGVMNGGAATGSAGTDPRKKVLMAAFDALPPSATDGLDPTGVAALNIAYQLYRAPSQIKPGTLESLSPTQQATAQSAANRVQRYTGRSWADIQAERDRALPRMGSVRAA